MRAGPLKVVTLVGTRPEIIKLSRVIAELDRHTTHVLVHSGQNYDYELNEVFFGELQLNAPAHFLDAVGESVAETIGLVIARFDAVLEAEQPDAVLVYGDTNSCLGVIAAKRRKIPVFHMEAGNRCFDQRVPEELNRKVVDHLSDVNMTHSEHARRYLLAEGLRPDVVMKTGSPMKEVLDHYRADIDRSDVLERLGLEPGGYVLVSAHREENIDVPENLAALLDSLEGIVQRFGRRVIVSTHPRTRARLDEAAGGHGDSIQFVKPFGFLDYVKLQLHAFCVASDSGTITEESSLLRFPAVMLREAHERPEGMDEGVLVMCGLRRPRVLEAIELVTTQKRRPGAGLVDDYDVGDVSQKVVRIVLSYVDYVNRVVWSRQPS
ncbi:MAG: non-hydrolyzing UDP-N-acetylglucosamine 2-epimerase [Acidimicrobiales bacterium]